MNMNMRKISSRTNEKIKHLKKLLTDKDYRYENQEFAVEGIRALDGIKDVKEIFVREGNSVPEIHCENIYSVDKDVFNYISSTEKSQGVIAGLSYKPVGSQSRPQDQPTKRIS